MPNPLMQYLDPIQPAQQPQSGADKYHGAIAAGYDAKREQSPKWVLEQRIIENMLDDLPEGATVLDAPIGTGRFLPYYGRRRFHVYGMDISGDMLNQAASKVQTLAGRTDFAPASLNLGQGSVTDVPLPDNSVDAAVNVRITRWLSPDECQQMIREMQRVARKKIIWTARVANHKHARSLDLFETALDGWRITRNEIGIDMDYRCLLAEKVTQ